MNRAASVLFECDRVRSQEKAIQEVVRNLPLQQFIRKGVSSREPEEDDIVLYQNGEKILNLKSSPLMDAGQKQIGTLVVINDVTQLRRLENVRKDFVANVSHEIKTPLTAIKGFVETLSQGSVDKPGETERFLGIVQKHVDRLLLTICSRFPESNRKMRGRPFSSKADPFWKFSDLRFRSADQRRRKKASTSI